jgi:PBP1b-binding outer membrane lipoprotein LpoB
MKRLLIICCLAVFLAGCAKTETLTKPEAKQKAAPTKTAAAKPAPTKVPPKGGLIIDIRTPGTERSEATRYAEIYLDGAFVSSTSQMQLLLDLGPHIITIKAKGYKSYEKTITILANNSSQMLNFLLEPE